MNARTALIATAVAVGAVSLPAFAQQNRGDASDNQAQQRQRTQQAQESIRQDLETRFPENAVTIADRDPAELRQTVAQMVTSALQPDKLNDAFTQFSRVNRNELGQISDAQRQALAQEIQSFEGAFKQRYNQDLNLSRGSLFQHAALVRVEVKDAQAIGRLPLRPVAAPQNRDVAANRNQDDDDAQPAAGAQGNQQRQQYGAAASTFGVENGSKIGLMGLPPDGGAARMILTAVEESRPAAGERAGEWRIIIPPNLTADTIAQNLTQHLRNLRQIQNQWPEDADQARDAVGRRVLMAFYNLDPATQSPRAAGAGAGAGQQNQTPRQQQNR